MVRFALPILALALGAALAVGLVSCGGRDEKGLLPGENAQQIVDNLNQVEQDTANGDCDLALQHAEEVQDQIAELGEEVNAQLRQRLADGAAKLEQLIPIDCVPATTAPPVETSVPEETSTETTTDNETTKSTTTSTTTTSSTTTPTTSTEPPTAGEGGGVLPPGQSGTPDQSNSGQGSG